MSYQPIVNGAPFFNPLGTQDSSTKPLVREPYAQPTHCPKVYFYAQKGPTTPQLAVGGSRVMLYGEDTFDPRSDYFNHATLFANGFNSKGNTCMYQRLLPKDAGPEANLYLSLEVYETQVDDYHRNSDGSYEIDPNTNLPKVKGQTAGFKVRWLVTNSDSVADMQAKYGKRTVETGTLHTDSKIYPIMDLKTSFVGKDGNYAGLRIWAPTTGTGGSFDRRVVKQQKVYPFRVSVIRKNPKTGTAKVTDNIFGEQSVLVTFKPKAINNYTERQMYIADVLVPSYSNTTDERYPPVFGDWGAVHVYQANIDTLIKKFYEKEKTFVDTNAITGNHDFPTAAGVVDGDEWLFNMISGQTQDAYPYHTFVFDRTAPAQSLGEYVNLYAKGSSDGTMNNTSFAALVEEAVADYLDPNSQVMNTALHIDTVLYDSGFPLETKKKLLAYIAERKNTFVFLTTYEVGGQRSTAGDENALATALRTRARYYPESDYFGTHVMRALIMGRNGKIRDSQWTDYAPVLYEVGVKSADYMGAANGKWKPGKSFDGAPGSILDYMYDINVPYTSVSVRNRDWDAGLNWVQSYDLKSNFIPALKTVYDDDTSVLNSMFTALAICEINNVAERAWRYYSGNTKLTTGQLAERIDNFIREGCNGKFDDRFIIEPQTYYTDADKARGYSGTTVVKLWANSGFTVMSFYVQAHRMSDYAATR